MSAGGSRWMPVLAKTLKDGPEPLENMAIEERKKTLQDHCSFQHIAAWVRRKVHKDQEQLEQKQQCVSECRLNTGPLYLHNDSCKCSDDSRNM